MKLVQLLTHSNINARKLARRLLQEDLKPIHISERPTFYYLIDTNFYYLIAPDNDSIYYYIHAYTGKLQSYPVHVQFIKYTDLEGVIAFLKEKWEPF